MFFCEIPRARATTAFRSVRNLIRFSRYNATRESHKDDEQKLLKEWGPDRKQFVPLSSGSDSVPESLAGSVTSLESVDGNEKEVLERVEKPKK